MVEFFHLLVNKRNLPPTLERFRRMLCRPNPSPDSPKVWLLPLPFHIPYIYYVSSTFFFYSAVFFSFPSRLFLAYPQYHSQFSLLYTISLFCVLFRLSISSMQCTNAYLHICLCAEPLSTKPTISNGMCFKYMSHLNFLVRSITFPFS